MSYCVKMSYYYVKLLGYLVNEACELVYRTYYYSIRACCFVHTVSYYVKNYIIVLNVKVVLSTQRLIMFKDHVIMLKACVLLSTQRLIMFKDHVIMLKGFVVLSTQRFIM